MKVYKPRSKSLLPHPTSRDQCCPEWSVGPVARGRISDSWVHTYCLAACFFGQWYGRLSVLLHVCYLIILTIINIFAGDIYIYIYIYIT